MLLFGSVTGSIAISIPSFSVTGLDGAFASYSPPSQATVRDESNPSSTESKVKRLGWRTKASC
jgi:hypothetical protein